MWLLLKKGYEKLINDPLLKTRYPKNKQPSLIETIENINDVVNGRTPKWKRDLEEQLNKRKNYPLGNLIAEAFMDQVEPEIGSVVHCELAGFIDHSGIYVGRNRIVHLDGSGLIEKVSPEQFINRLNGYNLATTILVSCKNGKPIGSKAAAKRARDKVGTRLNYSIHSNNCHKFSSGCLTGDYENTDILFSDLTLTTDKVLETNEWRVWNIK